MLAHDIARENKLFAFQCWCGGRMVMPPDELLSLPADTDMAFARCHRCGRDDWLTSYLIPVDYRPPKAIPALPEIPEVKKGRLDFIGLAFSIVAARQLEKFAADDPEGYAKMQAENAAAEGKPPDEVG